MDLIAFGNRVRAARERLGITQEDLAARVGIENYMTSYHYSSQYSTLAEFAVWERWNETKPVPDGYIMIFGHTPTIHFNPDEPWSIWNCGEAIGIDCGSGYAEGRLCCLRLDDMTVFYSDT